MNLVRKRVTYANVMSSIAVFLVLGGAAFAAATTELPKNSVGTKQLKKNAVVGSKVKNGSLTGADINLSTLGAVPSATNANHATSADSATNATNAANANHATSADSAQNALSFAGTTQQFIKYRASAGAGTTTIFSGWWTDNHSGVQRDGPWRGGLHSGYRYQ